MKRILIKNNHDKNFYNKNILKEINFVINLQSYFVHNKENISFGVLMSMRRVYETIVIINAALEDQDIDNVINKVTGYIENHGGVIQEINKWARRRLAYPINKKYNGYYVHIIFDALSNTIPILERFLVLEDTILRHLTLQLPQKVRDFRTKRALEHGKPMHIPEALPPIEDVKKKSEDKKDINAEAEKVEAVEAE